MALSERSLFSCQSLSPSSANQCKALKGCSQPRSQGSLLPVGERTWERGWAVLTSFKIFRTQVLYSELKGFPTSESLGRMGTSFVCRDFWDRLGGQALVMIGQWYLRQPLTNHK